MQGEQEGRNFFYCADGLGRARGAVTGPEAAAAWPAPPPQAQGHCPPPSWDVSPDGTDRKPGGGQGTVLGALVGLEVRSGHYLEGGPRGAEVGSGSRTCPADCCPHPQSGRWGTGTQRRVLFRPSPDPDCRQRGRAAFIHRCFRAIVLRKLRRDGQRGVRTGPCP